MLAATPITGLLAAAPSKGPGSPAGAHDAQLLLMMLPATPITGPGSTADAHDARCDPDQRARQPS